MEIVGVIFAFVEELTIRIAVAGDGLQLFQQRRPNKRCSCHGCHWQFAFLPTNTSNARNHFLPNTRPNPRTAISSESLMSWTDRSNTASLFHVVPLCGRKSKLVISLERQAGSGGRQDR
jgi:hypothetical protein